MVGTTRTTGAANGLVWQKCNAGVGFRHHRLIQALHFNNRRPRRRRGRLRALIAQMHIPPHPRRLLALLALVAACAQGVGCACLPRIDPTGQRLFICPKDQAVAAPLATPVVAGNLVAPPVVTDPVFPAVPAVVAPGAALAPGVAPVSVIEGPQDKLTMTPERILAPVGSEVVLKASICTTENFTLAEQKIEWMLGRNGVGQFVEVGGKGLVHPPLLPWNQPTKIDNYYATGYTASDPLCINRGTADPSDDVNILRGDAWASITSENEGTSYVTALTPTIESWNTRRAAATIYWVDVQWAFPPPAVAGSGRPEVLTTTVTRQSNGTPLEGYLVRYAVNDGGGTLSGGGNSQVVEVRTGADGRATVEVAPTASGAASSRIDVQLIRPPGFGGGDAPRLIVGSGTTVVNWGGGTPYIPPSSPGGLPLSPAPASPLPASPLPTSPPLSTSPATPIPTLPQGTVPTAPSLGGSPSGAPATIPNVPAGRPQIEIEIRGPSSQVQVGGQAVFEITMRNTGNAPATNIVLTDRFDPGFSYQKDQQRNLNLEYRGTPTLAPGEAKTLTVTFDVLQSGKLCHDVTVTFAEGTATPKRACVDALQPAPQRTATMKVQMDGPIEGVVGQPALFTITVKNTGETPLVDVDLTEEYPTTLQPRPAEQNVQVVSGKIRRTIPRLEPGQQKQFEVSVLPLQPTGEAYALVSATAQTDPPRAAPIPTADDHKMEILPARSAAAPPAGPAAAGAAGTLSVQTSFFGTARAGARTTFQVTLANRAATPDEQVQLRILFPPELTPDVSSTQMPPGVQAEIVGNELRFTPIASLRAGDPAAFMIPMNANQPGRVEVTAQAVSRNVPLPGASKTELLEISSR